MPVDSMFQQYSRPGYDYIGGDPEIDSHIDGYGLVVKDVFQLPENVSLADAGLDVGLALLWEIVGSVPTFFAQPICKSCRTRSRIIMVSCLAVVYTLSLLCVQPYHALPSSSFLEPGFPRSFNGVYF